MLVSLSHRLAYLAMPKTGTTALQRALAPHCDIRYGRSPRAKHMTMRTFQRFMLPYLRKIGVDDVETVCVVREPVDWLGSWYRYRSREALDGSDKSTKGVSFAAFVEAYLEPNQPPFAKVGRMSRFVAGKGGKPAVTHLFRYDNLPGLERFLAKRLKARLELPKINVSPRAELELPSPLRTRLEAELAADFALYADRAR
jgi:hypothetical protein